jgi:very-short-patch-repair endonuclease
MTSATTERARELRNNPTDAEKALWKALRESKLPYKFRRQYPIGPYFADIACKKKGLVIKIDGGQHDPLATTEKLRTAYLEANAYRVLRFWNNDVLGNIEGVMAKIVETLELPPIPPRTRGGKNDEAGL